MNENKGLVLPLRLNERKILQVSKTTFISSVNFKTVQYLFSTKFPLKCRLKVSFLNIKQKLKRGFSKRTA